MTLEGAKAIGEVGYKPTSWIEAYATGQITQPWGGRPSAFVGGGFRGRFGKRGR